MSIIFAVMLCYLSRSEREEGDPNPDLCYAGAVLYQFSYQANWELVIM